MRTKRPYRWSEPARPRAAGHRIAVWTMVPTALLGAGVVAGLGAPATPRYGMVRTPEGTPAAPDRPAGAVRLALGDFARPAAGARSLRTLPPGARLSPEAEPPAGTAAAPRTLTVRRDRTAGFAALGVTWRAGAPATVSVAARVRRAGGWTGWRSVATGEAGRDGGGAAVRDGAEMQWWGPSTGVELAVTALGPVTPRDVTVDLIDPGRRAADAAATTPDPLPPTIPAAAGGTAAGDLAAGRRDGRGLRLVATQVAPYLRPRVPMPTVRRRSAWGADPRKMSWTPELLPAVRAGAIHHTATANGYTPGQVPAILRSIYHFHAVSRGWGDIGYNVLVDRFGRLWEGRTGGLAASVIGGHTGGFNSYVEGVSMIGTFSSVAVGRPVIESISQYLAWKFTIGPNFDPRGRVRLVGGGFSSRWPPGTAITVPRIFPHRQTNKTECPGNRGVAALPAIRTRTASIMGVWANPLRTRARVSVFRPSTGEWFVRGITGPLVRGAVGYTPVPADYDGDGTTDLAVYKPATRTWLIWQSRSRTLRRVILGGVGQLPAPADVNGDGVTEPMVFAPRTGMWRRVGAAPVRWGGAADDVPVPADYTGDGRADLAVFRPGSRTWYVARGAGVAFGTVGDRPAPADYNGDGRVDFGAWTPATDRVKLRVTPARELVLPAGDTPLWGQYNGDLIADPLSWGVHAGAARFQYRNRFSWPYGRRHDIPLALV
ncbi:hypothetical protein GCM10010123_39260 [Pilimelia anulata]|uniref:Peptidoglycan recognition protein family domain-containing protein n=1 Tax=Pilimelia anulata TaxID=53371 RepID=A0A8J3BAS0_9ACTN|nr:N-acetylmuramoyl-L-alanine amidase [Pilimelia anulata]GGK05523.1 hypothetical protein GCM10010123_39260 [Pilimelia anulata]